jgi:hypothetical protein
MKLLTVTLVLVLGVLGVVLFLATRTSDQNGRTALNIAWDGPYALRVPESTIASDSQGNKSLTIRPQMKDAYSNFAATLIRAPNPPVHCRFALEGTVSYHNLPDNSVLQMTACSLCRTVTVQTSEDAGPQKRLSGTSEPRPFVIPYAGLPGEGNILQLELSVFVAGHPVADPATNSQAPSITLSNLRLVSFPDPTPEDLGLASSGSVAGGTLDWKSFFVGVTTAAVLSLATAQAVLLARRLKKLRSERELRRIASLDT